MMTTPLRRRDRLGRIVLGLGLAALLLPLPAQAQSDDCEVMRQELASLSGDAERGTDYAKAAQRQRQEIARTQAYADQIGCHDLESSLFSNGPPQCDAIETRIQRMTVNLGSLENQAETYQGSDPGRQARLSARYSSLCLANGRNRADILADPDDPGNGSMRQGFDDQASDGGAPRGKAICVRSCDGGYFPLGSADAGTDLTKLDSLCSALCPNTEAKLFTTPDMDDLNAAVAIDGSAYTALPAAFKFQKSFDAACTCKPADKTWVEALAQAEAMLDRGSKDVTVTQQMSDTMRRAVAATPIGKGRKATPKPSTKALTDAQAAAESALGAKAPTATGDSAGISTTAGLKDRLVKVGEGTVKTQAAPDGSTRRVRIIEPSL